MSEDELVPIQAGRQALAGAMHNLQQTSVRLEEGANLCRENRKNPSIEVVVRDILGGVNLLYGTVDILWGRVDEILDEIAEERSDKPIGHNSDESESNG